MKKKLTANLGLKILAVLISVIIWFIVVNINDPVDKTVFRNIPVEILNADVITNEGKVYEVLDGSDTIDVTVLAKRSILDTLGKDNIIATADMQELNFMDTMVRIKLSTNKYNDKLESIKSSSESLKVNIEDLKKQQFVIASMTTGEPAEGYILGNIGSDQNLISVSGPESIISMIDSAAVLVDVTGLSQDVRTDASVRLYDAEGNLIDNKNIKKSLDRVKVNVEILQTKRVPLAFASMGVPADGYALTGEIESNPSTVLIAGKSSTIKNISQIEVPDTELNVTGQNKDMLTVVEIKKYLPDGVSFADSKFDGRAKVTVHIAKEVTDEIVLEKDKVSIVNLPEGSAGELEDGDEEITLSVSGLKEDMEALEDAEITAVIDVTGFMETGGMTELMPGMYHMPVTVMLPDGVRLDEDMTMKVAIRKEENHNNNGNKEDAERKSE